MTQILHTLHINKPKADVLPALTTIDGLARWWTTTTEGACAPGESIAFRFGQHCTQVTVDAQADTGVAWTVQDSAPEWVGTQIVFDITETDGRTCVRFAHNGWAEPTEFYSHCSMKWATFLWSLKDYVERGSGRPFPHDLAI